MRERIIICERQGNYIVEGVNAQDFNAFLKRYDGNQDIFQEYEEHRIIAECKMIDANDLKEKDYNAGTGYVYIIKYYETALPIIHSCSGGAIIEKLLHGERLDGVTCFIAIHDFDWRAICYFNNFDMLVDFIRFIDKKSEVIGTTDLNKLSS